MTEEELRAIEAQVRCLDDDWTVDVGAARGRLAQSVPALVAEVRRLWAAQDTAQACKSFGCDPDGLCESCWKTLSGTESRP